MEERYRLGVLVDGQWKGHTYPGVFGLEDGSLAVAPSTSPIELLIALLDVLTPPYRLELGVLDSFELDLSEGEVVMVSRDFSREDLSAWLRQHASALESDARLAVLVNASEGGRIIYDEHNRLLLSGNWPSFEPILLANGLIPGDPAVPLPHAHHYRPEVTEELRGMLAATPM